MHVLLKHTCTCIFERGVYLSTVQMASCTIDKYREAKPAHIFCYTAPQPASARTECNAVVLLKQGKLLVGQYNSSRLL
jgi:hypothetical protein